jgi:hypothetical protein
MSACTYEAVPRLVLACTASQCLVTGKHGHGASARQPRTSPVDKVAADELTTVYIRTISSYTYATCSYK